MSRWDEIQDDLPMYLFFSLMGLLALFLFCGGCTVEVKVYHDGPKSTENSQEILNAK